jgi:plastocyanin
MSATHVVEIKEYEFHPKNIAIEVGDTVKWINRDSAPHTATRNQAPTFDTGPLSKNQESSEILFPTASDSAGFGYVCTPHASFMTGTVVVVLPGSSRASYSREAALQHHSHDKK